MKSLIIPWVCLILCLTSCLKEGPIKNPYEHMTPSDLADGWDIALPSEVGIDSASLSSILATYHNHPDYWQIRSISVFRKNKLIAETYCKDLADKTRARPIWSCTKQILSVLTGIAIERGLIGSVKDSIGIYLREALAAYPDKGSITIEDALTMRTGIGFSNYGLFSDDAALLQAKPARVFDFCIGKPLVHAPGSHFSYKDSDPQIISAIIEKQSGRSIDSWAQEALLSKLNISNFKWVKYKDSVCIGAFGILTTPRELAKIGQLVLNNGIHDGQRLIDSSYLAEMCLPHVQASDKWFGYLWWMDVNKRICYMSGNGGQFVMLKPEKDLMVLITSEDKTQGGARLYTSIALRLTEEIAHICQ